MIRITQKQLRRLVREAMGGGDDPEGLYDALDGAVERLQAAQAMCPQEPEFEALASLITQALDAATTACDGLSGVVGDPFA